MQAMCISTRPCRRCCIPRCLFSVSPFCLRRSLNRILAVKPPPPVSSEQAGALSQPTSSSHVFDLIPCSYLVAGGARSEIESSPLQHFFRRFAAMEHGGAVADRMEPAQCSANAWILKPVACGTSERAQVFTAAKDIKTYINAAKGDVVIQKCT